MWLLHKSPSYKITLNIGTYNRILSGMALPYVFTGEGKDILNEKFVLVSEDLRTTKQVDCYELFQLVSIGQIFRGRVNKNSVRIEQITLEGQQLFSLLQFKGVEVTSEFVRVPERSSLIKTLFSIDNKIIDRNRLLLPSGCSQDYTRFTNFVKLREFGLDSDNLGWGAVFCRYIPTAVSELLLYSLAYPTSLAVSLVGDIFRIHLYTRNMLDIPERELQRVVANGFVANTDVIAAYYMYNYSDMVYKVKDMNALKAIISKWMLMGYPCSGYLTLLGGN